LCGNRIQQLQGSADTKTDTKITTPAELAATSV